MECNPLSSHPTRNISPFDIDLKPKHYQLVTFGLERKRELKRIENSIFFHQKMKTNRYALAWKEMYTKVYA